MLNLFRFVLRHPLCQGHRFAAIRRVVAWQIASRLIRGPIAVPFTAKTSLLMERGMTGATGNYYCGLHEFEDMAFVLNLLRPDDLFVDIGANVGSYTVLAAGQSGANAVALEPVPITFKKLRRNIRFNDLDERVTLHNFGLGDSDSNIRFTASLDTVNHVASESDRNLDTIVVPVKTLDWALDGRYPICIKIDVEGFEQKVIAGADQTLRSENVQAVLMELNGSGTRYGFDEYAIHSQMLAYGFKPYRYEPFQGRLSLLPDRNRANGNTLYLREVDFIESRLESARPIELPWRTVACGANK